MPPDGKLSDAIIERFVQWIEMGASDPRVKAAAGAPNFAEGPREALICFILRPMRWLGVFLKTNLAHWAPFAASIAAAVLVLAYFWFLRLADDPAVRPMKKAPANPIRYLPKFFGQPRLRLSWLLAVGRSGWWSMYFVYAPIYVVSVGFSEAFGGAIVSMATATMFVVPLWGWAGRRFGLRRLLIVGYGLSAMATLGVAFGSGLPWLGAAVLVLAGFATGIIDGAGNLPFMRAVHPPERPEMTAVFMTYRDTAQMVPPGVFALLLRVFDLPAVFLAAGAAMIYMAGLSRHIPRRL